MAEADVPAVDVKQGVTKSFMTACEKFKIYLEDSKGEPNNLTGLIWKIRELDLHGVADQYEEAQKAGQELEDIVTALDPFCCSTFEEQTSVKVFANKMRTQLLSLILKAMDAINKEDAAGTSSLIAAIKLMRKMKAEAEKHREQAKQLRERASKLGCQVESAKKIVGRVVEAMKKKKHDQKLEIERKEAEMGKERYVISPITSRLLNWINGVPELKKQLAELGYHVSNTEEFLRCYIKAGDALGAINTYLLNEHNFWDEAAGLLKALQEEAQAKLDFFTMPDDKLDIDCKLVFLDSGQMELLNQILQALEIGIENVHHHDGRRQ